MSAKIKSLLLTLAAKNVAIHPLIKFFEGKDTSKENAVLFPIRCPPCRCSKTVQKPCRQLLENPELNRSNMEGQFLQFSLVKLGKSMVKL